MNLKNQSPEGRIEKDTIEEADGDTMEKPFLAEPSKESVALRTNFWQTILNIMKMFFGISILAGAHSYSESGIIGGIVGLSIGKI